MRWFWSPLSAVVLADLGISAPPLLLRRRLASGRPVDLIYAGDRMWPAIRHGQRLFAEPSSGARIGPGAVVVAVAGGVPGVLRVESSRGDELLLCADSDPADPVPVRREEVLATVRVRPASSAKALRAARRIALDLREALFETVDPGGTAEEMVRRKYEAQAAFYAADREPRLDPLLLGRIREFVARGGRILVAGSGTGPECLALEAEGWQVRGVDFSAAMVEQARKNAQARGSRVEYLQADLRDHREPPGSLDAVFFTYEVYSFIRDASSRIEVLERMRSWLGKGGVVFLSARMVHGLYQRLLLTARFLRRGGGEPGGKEWGHSHTRWLSTAGDLSRSFVRIFTLRGLRTEARRAGYEMGPWQGGHAILVPRDPGGRTRAQRAPEGLSSGDGSGPVPVPEIGRQ